MSRSLQSHGVHLHTAINIIDKKAMLEPGGWAGGTGRGGHCLGIPKPRGEDGQQGGPLPGSGCD